VLIRCCSPFPMIHFVCFVCLFTVYSFRTKKKKGKRPKKKGTQQIVSLGGVYFLSIEGEREQKRVKSVCRTRVVLLGSIYTGHSVLPYL
jgi:hypothetical protein